MARCETISYLEEGAISPSCRIKKRMGWIDLHLGPVQVAKGSKKCGQAGLHNADQSHLFVKVG